MGNQSAAVKAVVEQITAKGGMFPVVEEEIGGVPYRVFDPMPNNLREFYLKCHEHGDLDFIVYDNERYSFLETYNKAAELASALVEKLGVKKGDRVALAMRNYPEWVFAYMAVTAIGGIIVPMNAWWEEHEFEYGFRHSGAEFVIADGQQLKKLADVIKKLDLKTVVVRGETSLLEGSVAYDDLIDGFAGKAMPEIEVGFEDDATILYTSGSTGDPKGAVSTHRAVLSTMMSWGILGAARQVVADQMGLAPKGDPLQPAGLVSVPLFHVTGANAIFLLSLVAGRKLVFMYKWDADVALQLIEREKVTDFLGVPTMSYELMQSPHLKNHDISSLQGLGAGGAARPPEHVKLIKEKAPNAAPSSGYGLTETNAIGANIIGDDYVERPTSCGIPTPPLVDIKIMDDDGNWVETGGHGEVMIKCPSNIRGYWNDEAATEAAFTNGWFHTGDIGYMDDEDFVYIVDRKKDIVIRGGENISCIEVEAAIYEHPDVDEVAVFGLPDTRLGEELGAVVALKDGSGLTDEGLREHVGERLAKFKVPRYVWLQNESLPRTGTDKIFKRQLRDEKRKEISAG